jgi:hypothetical protein
LGPGADSWCGEAEVSGVTIECFRIKDAFHRADDGLRGAVGNFQFLFLDHFGFAAVVAGLDFPKEARIAAAPSVAVISPRSNAAMRSSDSRAHAASIAGWSGVSNECSNNSAISARSCAGSWSRVDFSVAVMVKK